MKKSSSNIIKADHQAERVRLWVDKHESTDDYKEWDLQDLSHLAGTIQLFSNVKPQEKDPLELPDFSDPQSYQESALQDFGTDIVNPLSPMDLAERVKEIENEAKDILNEAVRMSDQICQEAYEDGLAKARSESIHYLTLIKNVLDEIKAWNDGLVQEGDRLIFSFIEQIVTSFFGSGFELNREALEYTIAETLERANAFGDLRIHLNPQDAKLLEPAWLEHMEGQINQKVDIVQNASITPGGVVVKGDFGEVDSQIETRTQMLIEGMKNSQKGQPGEQR